MCYAMFQSQVIEFLWADVMCYAMFQSQVIEFPWADVMCYAMFQSQVIEFPWADLQEYDVEEEGMVFQFEYRRPNKKHKNVQILTQYVSRAVSALNIYKLDIFFKWAGIFLILAQMSLSICVLTLSDVLNVWRQISLIKPPPQNVGGGGYTGFALSRQSVGRSVSNSCPLYNSFINGRISFKLE